MWRMFIGVSFSVSGRKVRPWRQGRKKWLREEHPAFKVRSDHLRRQQSSIQLVRMEPLADPPALEGTRFDDLLRGAFSSRRKQLRNALPLAAADFSDFRNALRRPTRFCRRGLLRLPRRFAPVGSLAPRAADLTRPGEFSRAAGARRGVPRRWGVG